MQLIQSKITDVSIYLYITVDPATKPYPDPCRFHPSATIITLPDRGTKYCEVFYC